MNIHAELQAMNEDDEKLKTSITKEKDQRSILVIGESRYSCQATKERLAYLLQR
jgi:hypothetical protein